MHCPPYFGPIVCYRLVMKSPTPTPPPASAPPTGSASVSRSSALNPVGIKNIRVEIVVPAAILERVSSLPSY